MKKIAIFASGSGTNAENIISYFQGNKEIMVDSIFCNVPDAFVLKRVEKFKIPSFVFTRADFKDPERLLKQVKERGIDFIVLAGFLWLMPSEFVSAYEGRIVNIHPALLPNYGGKGMYGHHVHEAVVAAGEKESGITIHFVNARYDSGDIIFQARCELSSTDTPDDVAAKIHVLEQKYFPQVIDEVLAKI